MHRELSVLAHDAAQGKIYNLSPLFQFLKERYNGDWKAFALDASEHAEQYPTYVDMTNPIAQENYRFLLELSKAAQNVKVDRDDLGY